MSHSVLGGMRGQGETLRRWGGESPYSIDDHHSQTTEVGGQEGSKEDSQRFYGGRYAPMKNNPMNYKRFFFTELHYLQSLHNGPMKYVLLPLQLYR